MNNEIIKTSESGFKVIPLRGYSIGNPMYNGGERPLAVGIPDAEFARLEKAALNKESSHVARKMLSTSPYATLGSEMNGSEVVGGRKSIATEFGVLDSKNLVDYLEGIRG